MSEEKLSFQAEVAKLLKLMVNSVYSDKEVFLRELISNASDACDKLRYQAITEPALTADDPDFRLSLTIDKAARTIALADNGIGMNRDDLIADLGTIARSGTGAFVEQLSGDAAEDMAMIGQFGVGFYSVFMVADKVDVISRKAGEDQAWKWSSDGLGEFTIAEAERDGRGTTIVIHVRDGEDEWLEPERLKGVVKTHSDHIALPIVLQGDDGEESLNAASALWTRPKKDLTDEQYKEFYHHVGRGFDDPWLTVHYKAEGKIEYSVLLFVPTQRPFDLFDPARRHGVKLYVKRVFIADECEGLVPGYLRFLKGIVDSEDLPLNISREMLQSSPMVTHIGKAVTNRVLSELKKKAEKAPDEYAEFWQNFGPVLKEGIYEDTDRRDDLLALARFRSINSETPISLKDYFAAMKDGQKAIYYITGDDADALAKSPQLEGFRARGLDVLLLTDPVDDFWLQMVPNHDGKEFKSVTRGGADLSDIAVDKPDDATDEDATEIRDSEIATLIALLKQNLGDAVKDVRTSDRLTDSAVCLVADEGDIDMHLERMLKAHQRLDQASARILEINPRHALIKALGARVGEKGAADTFADIAFLLLDQARIIEGEPLPDPAAFSRRMADVMAKGLVA